MLDKLTVVLFKEGSQWVAVGLEKYIAAQGPELGDALISLGEVILGQEYCDKEKGKEPLSEIDPAPLEYFERLPSGK